MSLLGLIIELPYAILGKKNIYYWIEKQDSRMNTLACLFLATGGTFKCHLRKSPELGPVLNGD